MQRIDTTIDKGIEKYSDAIRFTIRPLAGLEDPLFPELLALYETAFPLMFRDDTEVFSRMIADGEMTVEIALETVSSNIQSPAMAGFFAWSLVDDGTGKPLIYLPYLAVHEAYRGKRMVGAALWDALANSAQRAQARAVLLEVEMPEDDPEYWAQRIGFYQRRPRWPARLLQGGYQYVQRIAGRTDNPTMWLMVAAPADSPLTPDEAFDACKQCFGDLIERTEGTLALESKN